MVKRTFVHRNPAKAVLAENLDQFFLADRDWNGGDFDLGNGNIIYPQFAQVRDAMRNLPIDRFGRLLNGFHLVFIMNVRRAEGVNYATEEPTLRRIFAVMIRRVLRLNQGD